MFTFETLISLPRPERVVTRSEVSVVRRSHLSCRGKFYLHVFCFNKISRTRDPIVPLYSVYEVLKVDIVVLDLDLVNKDLPKFLSFFLEGISTSSLSGIPTFSSM